MKIDIDNPSTVLCIKNFYGETEDGREFTIVLHQNDGSDWIDTIEHEDEFTNEELQKIENEFFTLFS